MEVKQAKRSAPATDPSAGLRASLRVSGLRQQRQRLLKQIESAADPELELELAYICYLIHDFDDARLHGEIAYREFRRRGQRRRAALAAAAVGRIHFEGFDNQPAARGWFARGRTLLKDEGDCVERGWVELGLVGCSVPNVSVLAEKAAAAVELARRFDDIDLECKALADHGLALVSLGRIEEGMELIDEAMAIVSTGDVQPFAAGQVGCCTLTACERAGDLARADAWLRALEQAGVARSEENPILFVHCQGAYGTLLCQLGRWVEAEAALTMSMTVGRGGFYLHRVMARGALADLRTRQGRFAEAERLLTDCGDRWESMPPRARLHFARGEFDHAAALVKQALRQIGADRVRAIPLLALLTDVELGRSDVEAAGNAAVEACTMADEIGAPQLIAQAALARGRAHVAAGNSAAAVFDFEAGLQAAARTDDLLIRAALHLDLGRALGSRDHVAAVEEARAALLIFGRLEAPEAEQSIGLLRRLGVSITYTPNPPSSPLSQLSRREREVLALVSQGMSNREIATRLFIAPKTVEHHVSNILSKLGLRSRIEVASIDRALVDDPFRAASQQASG